MEVIGHLTVAQIDFCQFGNTNPFRVKIRNLSNDVHDYFYVKKVDASRVYGLELEHILSPNRIFFIIDEDTIIEEHIMGIPCDQFVESHLQRSEYQEVSLAKEFIKFNEDGLPVYSKDREVYRYMIEDGMTEEEAIELVENEYQNTNKEYDKLHWNFQQTIHYQSQTTLRQ